MLRFFSDSHLQEKVTCINSDWTELMHNQDVAISKVMDTSVCLGFFCFCWEHFVRFHAENDEGEGKIFGLQHTEGRFRLHDETHVHPAVQQRVGAHVSRKKCDTQTLRHLKSRAFAATFTLRLTWPNSEEVTSGQRNLLYVVCNNSCSSVCFHKPPLQNIFVKL